MARPPASPPCADITKIKPDIRDAHSLDSSQGMFSGKSKPQNKDRLSKQNCGFSKQAPQGHNQSSPNCGKLKQRIGVYTDAARERWARKVNQGIDVELTLCLGEAARVS